jgi:8-oxo-dGTP pyrophosphatase MutT (NUDIX family)
MAHIHDKIDFTVEVFIVYNGRVLLRKHDKYKIWLSVGGHVELDEDFNQAAIREVKEEVGLDIQLWDSRKWPENSDEFYTELIPPVSMGRHPAINAEKPEHEHVVAVYLARAKNDAISIQYDDDRSDEWRWFTREELDTVELRTNVRNYAIFALDTLG